MRFVAGDEPQPPPIDEAGLLVGVVVLRDGRARIDLEALQARPSPAAARRRPAQYDFAK
jgi:hypothetical protein